MDQAKLSKESAYQLEPVTRGGLFLHREPHKVLNVLRGMKIEKAAAMP